MYSSIDILLLIFQKIARLSLVEVATGQISIAENLHVLHVTWASPTPTSLEWDQPGQHSFDSFLVQPIIPSV